MDLLAATTYIDIATATIPAAITAGGAVWAAARQQGKKLDKVAKSVSTSNGRTTGELVEKLSSDFTRLSAGQNAIQTQLAEHTVQDAANFAALEARFDRVGVDAGDVKALELQVFDLGQTVQELKENS